jgi:hypothetical protein
MLPHRSILVAVMLLAASCAAGDDPPEAPAEGPPAPSRPTATAAPPASSPEGPVLTAEGLGDLRIGMTREEVVAVAGPDANPEAVGGPIPSECDEFRPSEAPDGTLVMVENGRLTRISLINDSEVETEEGFAVGDPASEIEAAYGERAIVTPHKYVAAPARYITVWTTGDGGPDSRGILYEVGADGLVTHVRGGGPSIQYVEGCL